MVLESDDADRVAVFYSFNTDPSDRWENPEVHSAPPVAREAVPKMGINIVVCAMTH